MARTTITITTEIDLDLETGAKWFSGLSDDEVCRFLVLVAADMQTWGPGRGEMFCHALSRHLMDCECSTEAAREMVRDWAWYPNHPEPETTEANSASLLTLSPLLDGIR